MEPSKTYDPKSVESEILQAWADAGAFDAEAAGPGKSYCIVIPPPNVTAALHLGHALNNTLQDVLTRVRRMQGRNALWMPGTDHAGIATQTVVDKRLKAEGQADLSVYRQQEADGRDGRRQFVQKVQQWKDDYEARILHQLKQMGCSCDWRRTRFTMDEMCAKAVRATFFKLFSDGLIYRGKRLVNWDVATQTVLADDEVEHEEVRGHFYYLSYPLVESVAGVPPARDAGVSPARNAGILPACGEGVPPPPQSPLVKDDEEIIRRGGRYLPHWTQAGATYAITFRLADSVPATVAHAWQQERQDILDRAKRQDRPLTHQERMELNQLFSDRVDSYLDAGHGECLMKDSRIAEAVQNALLHFDGQRYELLAWAVMPNHVHAVVKPLEAHELKDILHSWKSFTAKEINRLLARQGQVWMEEYYDHLIRDEKDFCNQINYVLNNAEKVGLRDWKWVGSLRCDDQNNNNDHCGQDARVTRGQDGRDTRRRDACDTDRDTITHITVATTRPETMLGDTAIAMNPSDPRAKFLVGRKVRLPIVGREIPIIADEHVVLPDPNSEDEKARFSTGFLKVTPAHDTEDYAIRQRHNAAAPDSPIDIINVMAPDGTISDRHGWTDCNTQEAQGLLGLDRFEARKAIEKWFIANGLLEDKRDYTHQVGHSYRSHVPIEPYLSDQWYVAVKKPIPGVEAAMAKCRLMDDQVERRDGAVYIKGTDVPLDSLAGLALMPLLDGRLKFTPDRYANNYRNWLENLRDWPISRQLWWGHQIPVWSYRFEEFEVTTVKDSSSGNVSWSERDDAAHRAICELAEELGREGIAISGLLADAESYEIRERTWETWEIHACPSENNPSTIAKLEAVGFKRDPDVLDTWFSSALWPFSTLGWPDQTDALATWYPGDVLCTAREIITLWVSRMVMMGQYCVGDIPFGDVFIHAMIQDGEGRKMSKSLGNGIDPLDIIDSHGADAMRFTLVSMTTQTQDVRMPVEKMTLPDGRSANSSPKFDGGRNFANKLWNASRFAMMNLSGMPSWEDARIGHDLSDRWILSRLMQTVRDATTAVDEFRFNELADSLYHFMWDDFCDWYLEIAKSRINAGEAGPKAVVAYCLDTLLRLLHPIMPFITEAIWKNLNEIAPVRGPFNQHADTLLIRAEWPKADAAAIDLPAGQQFDMLRELIRGIRNARTQHSIPPGKKLGVIVESTNVNGCIVGANVELLKSQANLEKVELVQSLATVPAGAAIVATSGVKVYVLDIIDPAAELARLKKQADVLAKGIKSIEGKLSNEGFVSKAPPAVVENERKRLESLKSDLAAVEESLKSLQ